MFGASERYPEPNVSATGRFRHVVLVSITALGFLLFGDIRLFDLALPTADPPVVPKASATVIPPLPPTCSYGVGPCDWAGLRSQQPRCRFGFGKCDWTLPSLAGATASSSHSAALPSPRERCHYGIGACDWRIPAPVGVPAASATSQRARSPKYQHWRDRDEPICLPMTQLEPPAMSEFEL